MYKSTFFKLICYKGDTDQTYMCSTTLLDVYLRYTMYFLQLPIHWALLGPLFLGCMYNVDIRENALRNTCYVMYIFTGSQRKDALWYLVVPCEIWLH